MAEISLLQYAIVAVVAFAASVLGGVTGYGTGLLLPPVLLPIMGAEAIVPVLSVASLFVNLSRLTAFRAALDPRRALIVLVCAWPACLVGAYCYTKLSGPGVATMIGLMLILVVPARRLFRRRRGNLGMPGVALASVGYGILIGGTSGVGVVLLSILLAAGLEGVAVIATDAAVSLVLGVSKALLFRGAGALPLASLVMGLVIGAASLPGAFVAKRLTAGLSLRAHAWILDGVVVLGGVVMLVSGLRR